MLSIIIPTLNECSNIRSTILSIRNALSDQLHEIIIVDNGSTDGTLLLGTELADLVLVDDNATIGGLRNIGASASKGDILIFNDADVLLTQEWREEFDRVYSTIEKGRLIVGGSLESSKQDGWLYRCWFKPVLSKKGRSSVNYVGTGHMLVSREIFFECGGFNQSLATGEDSEFCIRAQSYNVQVVFNQRLKAIHGGYPVTLKEFFAREFWHGSGDFQNIQSFLSSKVAMFSSALLLLHILVIALLIGQEFKAAAVLFMLLLLFPIAYSLGKFGVPLGFSDRVANVFFAYNYLFARSLSWIQRRLN